MRSRRASPGRMEARTKRKLLLRVEAVGTRGVIDGERGGRQLLGGRRRAVGRGRGDGMVGK
jgi:hypothetical protein